MKAVWKTFLNWVRANSAIWSISFKYGLGLGLLTYVLIDNRKGLADVFERPFHTGPLLIATAITLVGLTITFMRWHLLVTAIGLPFSRYNAIRLGLAGYFFSTFLPGAIGGDIVKAFGIAREQNRRTLAVATVMFDRIVGLWALFWFVAIIGGTFWILDESILQNSSLKTIVSFTVIFAVASTLIWIGFGFLSEHRALRLAACTERIPKLGGSLAELWRACWMYRKQSKAVFLAMLLSMVGHMGWVLVFHFSIQAFESPHPEVDIGSLQEHMIVVPVGMVVSAVIPVPGGIGVGEAAYGELYKILGKPEVNGVIGCMSQRIVTYSLGFLGYLIYLRMKAGKAAEKSPEATTAAAPPDPDSGQPLANVVLEPRS